MTTTMDKHELARMKKVVDEDHHEELAMAVAAKRAMVCELMEKIGIVRSIENDRVKVK